VRTEPPDQRAGLDHACRLDDGEEVERLLQEAQAPPEREAVDLVADHQQVDERLAAAEVGDHPRGERERRLEGRGVGRPAIGVDDDPDAAEVLLLELTDDRDAGARPAPRVQVPDGIARAVGADTE